MLMRNVPFDDFSQIVILKSYVMTFRNELSPTHIVS